MRRGLIVLLAVALLAGCGDVRVRRSGGPFSPESLAIGALFASPGGGWTWFNDPRAISYGGYTYVGWLEGQTGDVVVGSVNETSRATTEVTLHAAFEVDDHDNPALLVRASDHKLVAFYSRHLSADYYMRVSTTSLDTDPDLSDGFAVEVNLDSLLGGSSYTYANPLTLSDDDGDGQRDYLFYRRHVAGVAHWYYTTSTDEWATAEGTVDLHNMTYSRVVSDGVDRIDVVVATHPNGGDDPETNKLYHLYRQSAAWHDSDGTVLGASPIDKTEMTMVYDSGGDPVWIWDIAYDEDGHPCIVFTVFASTTDHRYWYAHWNGAAWETNEIVAGGTHIPTAAVGGNPVEFYYSGGLAIDHEDANTVYAAVGIGSDEWQMRRYVTTDHGATWTSTTLAATGKNVRPTAVRGHGSDIAVVWMDGTYASYVDYTVATDYAGE